MHRTRGAHVGFRAHGYPVSGISYSLKVLPEEILRQRDISQL